MGRPSGDRFALDDRQIMAPIIDDFTRLTVGPIDDALMRADSLSLRDNNQPVRVNTKTDWAVSKAGRHAVTVALEGDQACWRHTLAVFNKPVKSWR